MIERLNLYAVLASLVPGILGLTVVGISFPDAGGVFTTVSFPNEFAFVALISAGLVAGALVQAIGSLAQPALYWVFGGRPSDLALDGELSEHRFPADTAQRIRAKLVRHIGGSPSTQSLFLTAMNVAESTPNSKASALNAQYGYHRALLTLGVITVALLTASRWWGAAATWPSPAYWVVVVVDVLLIGLLARRTYERGVYYVRETLLSAEQLLDAGARQSSETKPPDAAQSRPSL